MQKGILGRHPRRPGPGRADMSTRGVRCGRRARVACCWPQATRPWPTLCATRAQRAAASCCRCRCCCRCSSATTSATGGTRAPRGSGCRVTHAGRLRVAYCLLDGAGCCRLGHRDPYGPRAPASYFLCLELDAQVRPLPEAAACPLDSAHACVVLTDTLPDIVTTRHLLHPAGYVKACVPWHVQAGAPRPAATAWRICAAWRPEAGARCTGWKSGAGTLGGTAVPACRDVGGGPGADGAAVCHGIALRVGGGGGMAPGAVLRTARRIGVAGACRDGAVAGVRGQAPRPG